MYKHTFRCGSRKLAIFAKAERISLYNLGKNRLTYWHRTLKNAASLIKKIRR
jgi:hypothetical protein